MSRSSQNATSVFCNNYSSLLLLHNCDMVYKEVVHGDAWFNNMDNGELTGVVFLDIQKAFDSVYHNILLDKLKFYGISQMELKVAPYGFVQL